ncbi:threonine ammonia-lyase [Fimbriimonas ginsengisoli]|uniref:Pyridoxal-5'-phosphate-dependent protein beta subunit n=1 Tax=Fimbriimonas ginsengisoli Gsoil 348 TaxID=661478 RepID=A0A068NKU7_FIMGI|nr:pyridoxal-phosphate dependent enzyme [Fimbriimonas ginsengisoli]AIE84091.1 Pyridoxal-5'-phosphate-dependent protein beta subunit [Fimbriimonas ginsengisoli Gsoil 348]
MHRPTVFLTPDLLIERLGVRVTLAVEVFQRTGSFKFRAAYNVARNVSNPHLLTASSGNFGQALALAAKLTGKGCTVVMPATSSAVKIESVRGYGATVDLIDTTKVTREDRVAQLARENPEAYVASPFDDELVVAGNASLGIEIATHAQAFDFVVAPVGGGGLAAGLVRGLYEGGSAADVVGAEPALGNDFARSMREGRRLANEQEPQTLADGARTRQVGVLNWEILSRSIHEVIEVPEAAIRNGVRDLFRLANLKSEPTGALAVGAVATRPDLFAGKNVCCVVSGGNVDPALYAEVIASA